MCNHLTLYASCCTDVARLFLLAEYHNGSSNVTGIPFLKWSVTFESFRDEVGFSVANDYQLQQITLYPFITHIGENYLYRGYVETELKSIDRSYAYRLLSHGIEYIIVSQIVNDRGSRCGMLILEYTDASVIDEYNVKNLVLAGGVAANSCLRSRLEIECNKNNVNFSYPQIKYCTDNAAMIGVAGYFQDKYQK